jgi:hypothetical protein
VVTPKEDASKLLVELARTLPARIDGRSAIEQMMAEGSRQWRQMEWIGFWFEFFMEQSIVESLGATRGPRYGSTEFDIKTKYVWDLKVHPDDKPSLILNDQEAVGKCIDEHGGIGFIILEGKANYDDSGEFKVWHDSLKGKTSNYEIKRVAEGRRSRKRKVSFSPKNAKAVFIPDSDALTKAMNEGWLRSFQEGMRNSDGNPRRAKYKISDSRKIPASSIVGSVNFN